VLNAKKYQNLKGHCGDKDIEYLVDVVTMTYPEINSALVFDIVRGWNT
jgi:hypothetical protein